MRNKNVLRSCPTLTPDIIGFYLENSVELPVSPVDLVLEDVERVRMKEIMTVGHDLLSSCPVVVTEVNEVQLGVGKVDSLGWDIEGQTVGPVNLGGDDRLPPGPVHADPLNPGVLPPVSPEEPPGPRTGVEGEASGLGDVLVDEDHPVKAKEEFESSIDLIFAIQIPIQSKNIYFFVL